MRKKIPSLKCPMKGASLHDLQKRGPYGNTLTFQEPYIAYISGSPAKEPYLQFHLTQLPGGEIPHFCFRTSFISQRPRTRDPFQDPQRGPYGERCPSPAAKLCRLGCDAVSLRSHFPTVQSKIRRKRRIIYLPNVLTRKLWHIYSCLSL
jgi:hypothetical protein